MGVSEQPQDLTGVWQGQFSYPGRFDSESFVATLLEAGSWVTGSTHEANPRPDGACRQLFATVLGRRDAGQVSFIKTYDGSGGWTHSVKYDGVLSADGSEIEGTWATQGCSGQFLMIRQARTKRAATRKTFIEA